MRWLKNRKYRLCLALAAGMAGVLLVTSVPDVRTRIAYSETDNPAVMAWWGTMYPKFCFSKNPSGNKVKISFWLAKALGWC